MSEVWIEQRPSVLWPVAQDRRRPGRQENASPELIGLMRNAASPANRARVALYDAPGFLLPEARRGARRGDTGRLVRSWAVALVASSVLWAGAFKTMMWAWG